MSVAILAGGLATRLRPLTSTIPKALVPVAGKPFLLHQLEYLCSQDVCHVVLCTGYRAGEIEEVVGNGSAWGLKVEYSEDGETCADRLGRKAAQDRPRDRAIVEGRRTGTSDEGLDHGADPRCY